MAFPTTLLNNTSPAGTSLLTSPDHASLHATLNVDLLAAEKKIGLGAGTPTANKILVGSGNGTASWIDTVNSLSLGTPAITGGTINNATLGTPAITGGTSTSQVINTPTGDVATLVGTQTLTNKTLTSPVIRAYDGWIDANETWTYASASTITVPAGAASKYQIRDKIKWTQTTVKYGVLVAVADTLLTIAVNTDYVVTDAAISANYYSHEATPMGYPKIFNNTDISLADALNSNLAVLAGTEFVRLPGGGASATIGGIVAGVNGQRLILQNITGGAISFLGENASSTAANRIFMGGLTTVVVGNLGAIELIYSTSNSRWIIISKD